MLDVLLVVTRRGAVGEDMGLTAVALGAVVGTSVQLGGLLCGSEFQGGRIMAMYTFNEH